MDELRSQAMLAELEAHRSLLGTRAAQLAGELAVASQRIAELEKEVAELRSKQT